MERYVINALPPSYNQYLGKNSRWTYVNDKKKWVTLIEQMGFKGSVPHSKCIIAFTYHFKDKRKRDYDNYANKMVLDAMTRNHIIEDDNSHIVRPFTFFEYGCGQDNEKLVIEIYPVDELPSKEDILGELTFRD